MSKASDVIRDATVDAEEAIRNARASASDRVERAREAALRARDEARLKAHLLEMEAKERMDKLAERVDALEFRFRKWSGGAREELNAKAGEASEELADTYEEVREGFARIRDAIID